MADSLVMSSENSSIGDAVSGRGEGASNEDEDLYYIPERRLSLDLGPAPMDTSHWHFVDQALSPAESYGSLNSDDPEEKEDEEGSSTRVQLERAESFSSCYSIDSNDCEKIILREKSRDDTAEPSNKLELIQDPDEIKHPSLTLKFTFKALCDTLKKLQMEFSTFKWKLWTHFPQPFSGSQSMDIVGLVDRLLETYGCEKSVVITRTVLVTMSKNKLAEFLQTLCTKNEVRYELCTALKKKFAEELIMEGETMPLDDIYTDLLISSAADNGPNIEHEIMKIDKLNTKRTPDKLLSLAETLSQEMLNSCHARLMFLHGVAGSGKSMFIKKLVLDWALERSHQHFSFIFPLALRELKQFESSEISLEEIIWTLYPETKRLKIESLKGEDNALFIFDGLDEYTEEFDFAQTEIHSDSSSRVSLNINLVNILRGRLLSNSMCLVTTRPQVNPFAPWDAHYDELEVCGFSDANKDEYFKKRFKDPNQAATVIQYVKSLKSLHIMCHLPLVCTLVADECQRIFRETRSVAKLPRSLTYMYTKLLLTLVRHLRKTRAPDLLSPEAEQNFLLELGKLAFTMLEKGQFKIASTNWPESIAKEAVVRSGLCTQYTITPYVLFYEDMVSFLHPTVQEYLAALYAYLTSRNQEKNIFDVKPKFSMYPKGHKIMDLYKAAMEKSLQSQDGKLDMFLRFLFGMACKTNQELLHPFLKSPTKAGDLTRDCVSLIKKVKEPSASNNLQRCLEELGDVSF
ncbi:NACHT, LRR and PYD domains-containing protein 3 [Girardinichthys multiradiatus]|uniref:NACHT, LRR and PYD domains-containing protein 3 n=1 Tax=Girardinichthys multiradiatus TaxID=208333 RepID=UPI001FADF0DC|nr:NACHT, LRR and PYD domains-containing protein 3 [Girardinichthys multiradiatus]